MNRLFILLLRAGVMGKLDNSANFNNADWNELEQFAAKQNVLPLVFDGVQLYFEAFHNDFCKFPAFSDLQKIRWFSTTQQVEKLYEKHLSAIYELSDFFQKHGVKTAILKGYSLSLCYPKPEHRACGDIDIYQFGEWKKADELLSYKFGIIVDEDHHHHTVYHFKGVSVENHYDFMNVYAHKTHKVADKILKKMAAEEEPQLLKNGVMLASPNVHALFTLIHNAEHFVCESIDLRRLCDWWLLRKQYADSVDWQKVEAVCEELGMEKFLHVMDEVSRFVLEYDMTDEWSTARLTEDGSRVLQEILHPQFEGKSLKGLLRVMWWKLRRWWAGRWKMQLVYQKENLTVQFFYHLHGHLMKPKNMVS